MVKQTKSPDKAIRGGSRPRQLAFLTAGLLVVTLALASLDLVREQRQALTTGDAALRDLARVADALWLADEARIQALLARLRIELRADGSWSSKPGLVSAAADPASTRRTDTLLRRALEGVPEIRSIDLVVAGPEGLSSLRVAPAVGLEEEPAEPRPDGEDLAKTLWYADEVRQAVEARGRRIARGALTIDSVAGAARSEVRAAIALHDSDEVVQGALVATIDLGPLGTRLASLASAQTRFALVGPDGQRIGESANPPTGKLESLLTDPSLAAGEGAIPILAAFGRRSLIQAAPQAGQTASQIIFWLERDAPRSLFGAAFHSPWPLALGALALLFAALIAWPRATASVTAATGGLAASSTPARESESRGAAERALTAAASEELHADAGEESTPIRRERFVLRDWLADVRGCLEREAATRGLTLDLRCERSLPREIEQDPLWLGGLLVSLGREALDATRASRVALEVTGESDSALRFEIDAGDADLAAVTGMNVIAGRLGAELDKRGPGRLAVVIPGAVA